MARSTGALLAAALALAACASPAAPTLVVDLTSPAPPIATLLAAQVCLGLLNRNGTLAYSLMRPEDATWLAILEPGPQPPPGLLPLPALLARCTAPAGAASGYIRYSFSAQQVVVPNLVTLAGVLGAVPLEDGSPYIGGLPLLFDALAAWPNYTALQATTYMYETHANSTTGMAKMNPGLDVHGHPLDPPLTLLPDLSLADYIVSARLFNFFLAQGCLPGTADHALMERMVQANPWPRPLAVLGYDDTYPLAGGDTFEAETNCVAEHSLGQVATTGVNNLAYFSARSPPLAAPLLQPPPLQPPEPFSANLSYVALVVGDGDNVAMVKGSRQQWFQQRLQACANRTSASAAAPCYPLCWTLSPALQRLAPDMARWFFAGAAATGADYFVLPPSGHLYAYPGSMAPADAAAFVRATEADAVLYNASATVEWEWLGTWGAAIANFTPRYAQQGTISAVVAVNVPYMVPIVEFAPGEDFKALGSPPRTVLFRPNEWRGDSGAAQPALHPFLRNASQVAQGLLAAPRGSASAIYLTSDGGGNVQMLDELAALLAGSHVRVVDVGTLSRVALESLRR